MTRSRKHSPKPKIQPGKPYPVGATVCPNGVNFALASGSAEKVELCLFDSDGLETRLDLPAKTGAVFHGFVAGIGAGQRYGYRVHGESNPADGRLFNPQKLLADPYSRRIDGKPVYGTAEEMAWYRPEDMRDNAAVAPKSVVTDDGAFDWGGDKAPDTPWAQTVIYEVHVKGFTKQFPDLKNAGTYLALADKRVIAYLKSLGVTAVELLPVQQHLDEYHLQRMGLRNYWGYNTYSHFAAEPAYAADAENAADELRRAVKALHKAGIEVILDVVYNHTAEQDSDGPMLCQRGIDNPAWYWMDGQGGYENWSGCGNTLNLARRDVARWAADSLRYWVEAFHIDGFRFDLGTILAREPDFRADGRFFQMLYQDPVLARVKLIAEAWDLGPDGYRVGGFPHPFAEWNGLFRDDMRAFWVWESGNLGKFAERLAGSSDIFRHSGRSPSAGLNFITAHDGFTLNDLVSYNEKHNEANGENNRDGHNENISFNHGAEGATDDAHILAEREYTAKALLASLLLSNGTPMLLGGDEFGNSQQGNNNGYCQDNETAWLTWPSENHPLQEYVRQLTTVRRQIALLSQQDAWWDGGSVTWLNTDGLPMSEQCWHNHGIKAMQVLMEGGWLLLVNAKKSRQTFTLPEGKWQEACAPSPRYTCSDGLCTVEHMGLWVFKDQAV
ncbi:glycogen debranching protein GlgX [Neisseria sp.]|uniref:glycogen debranching protein GlgX n=1 Tax=Neisseria sp. TaxID=192066 RepID=UPI0035A12E6D